MIGATIVALVVALSTAGCSEAEPVTEPPLGQVARTATIDALDLVLVTNGKGVARLVGTLVNQADEPDRLVGVDLTAEPPGGYSVVLAKGPFTLREDEPFRLYRDAEVTVVADALRPGFRADLTLAFARSGSLTTTVPIEPNTGVYRDIEVTRPPDGDIRPGS